MKKNQSDIWCYLKSQGWVERKNSFGVYVLVRFSHPRLGFKQDGTLIIGYHEYPEKIESIKQLNEMICRKSIEDFWLLKENPTLRL